MDSVFRAGSALKSDRSVTLQEAKGINEIDQPEVWWEVPVGSKWSVPQHFIEMSNC